MPDTVPVRWTPKDTAPPPRWGRPGLFTAMWRGAANRCPCCGRTRLFAGWLQQARVCAACHAPLGAVRADDAPPYFVILIVAHVIIGGLVALDMTMSLPVWVEIAIFLPLTLIMSLGLLRPVKGALIGLMLQLGMVSDEAVAAIDA